MVPENRTGGYGVFHFTSLLPWPWPSRQPVERRLWAGTANRPKVRVGSNYDLRHRLVSRLECDGEPTFGPEGRLSGGEQTYFRQVLNFAFVPIGDIHGIPRRHGFRCGAQLLFLFREECMERRLAAILVADVVG